MPIASSRSSWTAADTGIAKLLGDVEVFLDPLNPADKLPSTWQTSCARYEGEDVVCVALGLVPDVEIVAVDVRSNVADELHTLQRRKAYPA